MRIMTNHLSDEDLILHYYGETARADETRVTDHLASCGECQAASTQLRRVLTLVDTAPAAEARPGFERDVWARLEPQLDANTASGLVRHSLGEGGWRTFFWAPQWALAGGVAALVLVAFMAGRLSNGAAPAAPATPQAQIEPGRVLHAAVGDHLDRTQMMLAELVNADTDQLDQLAGEQARASDLIAVNRLIRQSAEQSGDAAIADVLEDLERVLLEIANAPADVTSNELSDLKARITTQDLLFRVRVTASEMRQRTVNDREAGDRTPRRLPTS